jgi:hypothetical protein
MFEARSVYLAARFSRRFEMQGYRADLQRAGFVVTSRWSAAFHFWRHFDTLRGRRRSRRGGMNRQAIASIERDPVTSEWSWQPTSRFRAMGAKPVALGRAEGFDSTCLGSGSHSDPHR